MYCFKLYSFKFIKNESDVLNTYTICAKNTSLYV